MRNDLIADWALDTLNGQKTRLMVFGTPSDTVFVSDGFALLWLQTTDPLFDLVPKIPNVPAANECLFLQGGMQPVIEPRDHDVPAIWTDATTRPLTPLEVSPLLDDRSDGTTRLLLGPNGERVWVQARFLDLIDGSKRLAKEYRLMIPYNPGILYDMPIVIFGLHDDKSLRPAALAMPLLQSRDDDWFDRIIEFAKVEA